MSNNEVFTIWLRGKEYSGTWSELYTKLRQGIEICHGCKAEYKNLKRAEANGLLFCPDCIEYDSLLDL